MKGQSQMQTNTTPEQKVEGTLYWMIKSGIYEQFCKPSKCTGCVPCGVGFTCMTQKGYRHEMACKGKADLIAF